jgi:phosphoglycolate phosphatase-like HAD superfamily hydrolase
VSYQLPAATDAVFFDLDGTLLDTHALAVYALREAKNELEENHSLTLPRWTDDELVATVGYPGREQAAMLLPPELAGLAADFRRAAQKHERRFIESGQLRLFPGIRELLCDLASSDLRVFLASNCSVEYRDRVFAELELHRYFDEAFCIGLFPGKRKADMVEAALAKHTECSSAVMVGDRASDIRAGRENGLFTVACCYGFGKPAELEDAALAVALPKDLVQLFTDLLQ